MGAIIQSQHDLIKFWSKRWHEPLNTVATSEAWHKFFIKLIMHGGEHQNIQIYECNYQKWKKFEYVRVHAKWVCSKNIPVKYVLHHCVELCLFVSTASLSGELKWKSTRQTWKDTLYFVHIFCIHSGSLPNW